VSQPDMGERRLGGVMTNHSRMYPGQRTTTVINGSSSTVSVQSVNAYQKILSGVASVDGDHKTPNPHAYQTQRINYGTGLSVAGIYPNQTIISGHAAVGFSLSATWQDASNEVFNRCISQLTDHIRGDVDLSVDAFQAKQAGVMLNKRFSQGRELFLKKAPFALVAMQGIISNMKRSRPRDWGSLWLEWVYGWKPLAQSIYGAMDQMLTASTPGGGGTKLSVKVKSSQVTDRTKTVQSLGNGQFIDTWIEGLFQCRMQASYAMNSGGLQSVGNYTSLNPISIAWELVPYSFVADWFINVGGYLRNMETSLLYSNSFVGGMAQRRRMLRVLQVARGGNVNGYISATGEATIRNFQRVVFGSNPIPRAPSFNPKLGTSRLISAAALLAQQLRGARRVEARVRKGLPGHNEANWDLFPHS
jgi:hypothetical protein